MLDDIFEAALADADNVRVMMGVCRQFRGRIPPEELAYCRHMALFKCLKKHDPGRSRFTTSLTRYTLWECRKALRALRRQEKFYSYEGAVVDSAEKTIDIRDCLESLPEEQGRILHDYHIAKMTMEEIAQVNGYSTSTAVERLKGAEASFRRLFGVY